MVMILCLVVGISLTLCCFCFLQTAKLCPSLPLSSPTPSLSLVFSSSPSFQSGFPVLDHRPAWDLSPSRLSVPHPDDDLDYRPPRRFSLSSSLPSLHAITPLSPSVCLFVSPVCVNAAVLLYICGLSSFQVSLVERRSCGSGPN